VNLIELLNQVLLSDHIYCERVPDDTLNVRTNLGC